MRKVEFDTSGVTSECPKSDIGVATSTECGECRSFSGFEGFDSWCKYSEPDVTDMPSIWTRAKGWIIRVATKIGLYNIAWGGFWIIAFLMQFLPF